MGFLLALMLVAVGGVWGYGRYVQAARARQERAMAEARSAEDRRLNEAMQAQALMDPNLGINAMDRRIAAAAPDADPDGDRLSNRREAALGTDPLSDDTDGDGLADGDELDRYGSDPRKASTAGDGVSDLVKVLEQADPKSGLRPYAQPFQQEYAELGVILRTTDPASRHLHQVEAFHRKVIDDLHPVREPIILRDFTGDVSIAYPGDLTNPKRIKAYRYDLAEGKLEVIDGQKNDIVKHRITYFNAMPGPVLLLDQEALGETEHTFYLVYYRPGELFPGIPSQSFLVEIDPVVFFPRGQQHDGYIHVRVPQTVEEEYFQPIYEGILRRGYKRDETGLLREVLNVVRVKGTYAQAEFMLLHLESAVPVQGPYPVPQVYDSGFRVNPNGFSFKNPATVVSPNGICLGMATVAERIYNGTGLPSHYGWQSSGELPANGQKEFAYNWPIDTPAYKPIRNGHPFEYTFTDPILLEDLKGQPQSRLDSTRYSEADRELIRALELYWVKANEEFNDGLLRKIARKLSRDYKDAALIDRLKQTFQAGDVVTVLVEREEGGHAVNGYRLTEDAVDPNVFWLDVYDNNFPNNFQVADGKPQNVGHKLRIKLIRRTKQGLWETQWAQRDVFEFELPSLNWSSAKGDRLFLMKDGLPMFE